MIGSRLGKLLVLAILLAFAGGAQAAKTVESPPLASIIKTSVRNVKSGKPVAVPVITWGGDMATILANGGSTTTGGSIFGKKGLSLKIFREDDFKKQVQAYLSGDTPYLRGTMGMINMASEVISRDPRTKPVVIYQMTWSNGGDCLVVKSGIKTAKDLKGKTIALQAYGPHVDYLTTILRDAGLSLSDVNIVWARDLSGTEQSPAELMYQKNIDACFVIIPDGLALTSDGTVGTGAEGSVKGARILLSTRTASRVISDVYVVRKDYFDSHRDEVQKFVHGLMLGAQELKKQFDNKGARTAEFRKTITAAATILLDSAQATGDAEALYGDCEFVGFRGNVRFFGDKKWPRNMDRLTKEIQSSFKGIGLLGSSVALAQAQWNYDDFRTGLAGIDDVVAPRFKKEEVARVITQKQAMGTLGEGELFSFEINFQPNQKVFSTDLYSDYFEKVVELAATYGGAVITVEGHSDPHKYNKLKKKGASEVTLSRTKQAAKNLSISRAISVREAIMTYAESNGIPFDESQFSVVGHGISQPLFPLPKTKEQWRKNMRVVFRIIQIEAEDSVFEPL